METKQKKICLVGAGYIADTHAEVLRGHPDLQLAAIVELRAATAEAFARRHGVPRVFASAEEAIAEGPLDGVHVLVPPDRHRAAALPWLEAAIPTLLEKPLAVSTAEAKELLARAEESGAALGVNQNFVFHPAFRRLQRVIETRRLGALDSLSCTYSMPLRHLQTGQFSHWMFREPKNILLEQAVHPLSQLAALAGARRRFTGLAGAPRRLGSGGVFHDRVDLVIDYEACAAHLRFSVGNPYPIWTITAHCSDGVATCDMIANRLVVSSPSKWLEAADHASGGLAAATQMLTESAGNFVKYGGATLGLGGRADAFFVSMRDSIADFHAAVADQRAPVCSAAFGADLVALCEEIGERLFEKPAPRAATPRPPTADHAIAVLGGTGFIGRELVRQLLEKGERVGVLARSTINLPALYEDERVTVIPGDVGNLDDVKRAIGPARVVINLAHGGGGATWSEIERTMVGSARTVAEACVQQGVTRLIHVGSIAGLYLGDENAVITNDTPPDPRPEQRADYARGKAVADEVLLDYHRHAGLNVVILRPGVVVGAGTPPLHSGVGFFNSEQHCLGWNKGDNPLPFVLVEDVARAIIAAVSAPGIDGRCLNVVGDVRLTAREYIDELAAALGRPIRFHPQTPEKLLAIEWAKWAAKRVGGRTPPLPSLRDFKSRGLVARFDCADTKERLDWRPVSSRDVFIERAIKVHAARPAA